MLTVFDDMIADTLNKKLNPIVTEIFIRGRKLNFLVFITKSYFAIPKKYQTKFYTLFYSKKYQTKFYTLLYSENSKQTRTSTNPV